MRLNKDMMRQLTTPRMTDKEMLELRPGALLKGPVGGAWLFLGHVWPEVAEDIEDFRIFCSCPLLGACMPPVEDTI